MERGAVNRPLLLGQEDWAREGSAYLQPGAQGSSLFAHEVVLARVRAFQPVHEDLGGFGVVVAELEHADLRRAQAGAVGDLEHGTIADRRDGREQARELVLGQELDLLPLALGFGFLDRRRREVVVRQQNVVVRWNGERVEASRHFKEHVIERYRQGSMKTFLRKEILLNYPLAVRAARAPHVGSGRAWIV